MTQTLLRTAGRAQDQLRDIQITTNFIHHAEGSVLVEFGRTRVICTATYEENIPKWLMGSGKGWVTAEYGMLPRATETRNKRDKTLTAGRTQEISRLIARSLRAAVDLKALGEKQITVDCDVIQADGGTRTASVTGGFIALALALKKLHDFGELKSLPLIQYVSAVSVGLQNQKAYLDLDYIEDSAVGTDMNFVMTNKGQFIELQGTAERESFDRKDLNQMIDLAEKGCRDLFKIQERHVGSFFPLEL